MSATLCPYTMKARVSWLTGGLIFLISDAASRVPLLAAPSAPTDSSPLHAKAAYFQRDLLDKHWLDGLYVSIVPAAPTGTRLPHTVHEPGNVIHAGVWTGRYLAGVGYQYAVTRDPWVPQHGGEILRALRILQEVTGKPGLLARGYVVVRFLEGTMVALIAILITGYFWWRNTCGIHESSDDVFCIM